MVQLANLQRSLHKLPAGTDHITACFSTHVNVIPRTPWYACSSHTTDLSVCVTFRARAEFDVSPVSSPPPQHRTLLSYFYRVYLCTFSCPPAFHLQLSPLSGNPVTPCHAYAPHYEVFFTLFLVPPQCPTYDAYNGRQQLPMPSSSPPRLGALGSLKLLCALLT